MGQESIYLKHFSETKRPKHDVRMEAEINQLLIEVWYEDQRSWKGFKDYLNSWTASLNKFNLLL